MIPGTVRLYCAEEVFMIEDLAELFSQLANEDYCYLTTQGRVSGHPHEIEIWFGSQNNRVYLLSGSDRSDWVKNFLKDSKESVQIAHHVFTGTAHIVKDEKKDEVIPKVIVNPFAKAAPSIEIVTNNEQEKETKIFKNPFAKG